MSLHIHGQEEGNDWVLVLEKDPKTPDVGFNSYFYSL